MTSANVSPFSFFSIISRGKRWLLGLNSIFYMLGSISMLSATYFLGLLVTSLTTDQAHIKLLCAAFFAALIGYEGFYRLGHICEIYFLAYLRKSAKNYLLNHSYTLSYGHFSDKLASETTHQITAAAECFERLSAIFTNNFIEDGMLTPMSAILMCTIHWTYGAYLLIWALLFASGSALLAKKTNRLSEIYAAKEAATSGSLGDIHSNINIVKVYGNDAERLRSRSLINDETEA